jgi:hypothetical protein
MRDHTQADLARASDSQTDIYIVSAFQSASERVTMEIVLVDRVVM